MTGLMGLYRVLVLCSSLVVFENRVLSTALIGLTEGPRTTLRRIEAARRDGAQWPELLARGRLGSPPEKDQCN